MAPQMLKDRITFLYEGETDAAHRFRYGLLAIDVATILFLVVATFIYGHPLVEWVGIALGLYIALDYAARIWSSLFRFCCPCSGPICRFCGRCGF